MEFIKSAKKTMRYFISASHWIAQGIPSKKRLSDEIIVAMAPRADALQFGFSNNIAKAYLIIYNSSPLDLRIKHSAISTCIFGYDLHQESCFFEVATKQYGAVSGELGEISNRFPELPL